MGALVVGLYVDPRAHAVVLPLDGKSQIQALTRTQDPLPMKPGHIRVAQFAADPVNRQRFV